MTPRQLGSARNGNKAESNERALEWDARLKSTTMLVDASYQGFAEQRRMTARRIPIWMARRGKNGQGTVNERPARREGLASSAGHRAGQAGNGCSFRNPSLSFDEPDAGCAGVWLKV
jgi:hypothetical protein